MTPFVLAWLLISTTAARIVISTFFLIFTNTYDQLERDYISKGGLRSYIYISFDKENPLLPRTKIEYKYRRSNFFPKKLKQAE